MTGIHFGNQIALADFVIKPVSAAAAAFLENVERLVLRRGGYVLDRRGQSGGSSSSEEDDEGVCEFHVDDDDDGSWWTGINQIGSWCERYCQNLK